MLYDIKVALILDLFVTLTDIEATSITPSDKRRESIFAQDLEESPLSIGPPKLSSRRSTPDQSLDKLNEFLAYRPWVQPCST